MTGEGRGGGFVLARVTPRQVALATQHPRPTYAGKQTGHHFSKDVIFRGFQMEKSDSIRYIVCAIGLDLYPSGNTTVRPWSGLKCTTSIYIGIKVL